MKYTLVHADPHGSRIFVDGGDPTLGLFYVGDPWYPGPLELVKPPSGYLTLIPTKPDRLEAPVHVQCGQTRWSVNLSAGATLFLARAWEIKVKLRDHTLAGTDTYVDLEGSVADP